MADDPGSGAYAGLVVFEKYISDVDRGKSGGLVGQAATSDAAAVGAAERYRQHRVARGLPEF